MKTLFNKLYKLKGTDNIKLSIDNKILTWKLN